jgi:hypothetical protein
MRIAKAPRGTKGKTLRSNENGPISGGETERELSPVQCQELLRALKARFEKNMNRHKGLEWAKVKAALRRNLAERAIDGVFSDRGFSIDSAV